MRAGGREIAVCAALALLGAAPAARAAGADCPEPAATWARASPAAQGLDADQLDRALHAYQDRRGYAVRIYRNGCLVARDTNAGTDTARFETWEITSSVLGLVAGREMQLGLLSPEDPVGSLVPEADGAHGAIRVRELLEQTSGLAPGADDAFLSDRLRLALARPLTQPPGRAFGDSPLARALLAEVLQRAAGEDPEGFTARELFGPLGIRAWSWRRDKARLIGSTFGLALSADDLARLAELLRRGGAWRGRQLLDPGYVRQALAPSPGNACLGWLTWLNAGASCNGTPARLMGGLPSDLWSWRGRFDQRVTVLPAQGLVVVRLGATAADLRSGSDEASWERGVLTRLLGAVRDTPPGRLPGLDQLPPITDGGWHDDLASAFAALPALGAAGPSRARAPRVVVVGDVAPRRRRGRTRGVRTLTVRITCPPVPARACAGTAVLAGTGAAPLPWSAPPGAAVALRLRAPGRRHITAQPMKIDVVARDDAGGVGVSATSRPRP